jgi:ribosomal protein S18 acetylase RimI-like enzyme
MITNLFNIEVTRTNRYCYVNAVQDGERIGKVCVDLDSDDSVRYTREFGGKFAKLILISTSPSHCGQGIATALMNRTIQELQDYNLYLNVIPLKRNESDKDKNQLIRFYSKFGFKIYESDICTTTMVRLRES